MWHKPLEKPKKKITNTTVFYFYEVLWDREKETCVFLGQNYIFIRYTRTFLRGLSENYEDEPLLKQSTELKYHPVEI